MRARGKKRIATASTREQMLRALKTNDGATIAELAKLVGVSPVTVRHHLSSLQAGKLVSSRTAKRSSVGRPYHTFHLTDDGEELFPRQYLGLSKRLLDQIKIKLSPEIVPELFEKMAAETLARHQARFEGRSEAERMEVLDEILEAEGFVVSWQEENGERVLVTHSCPYRNLGRQHPEICAFDHALISQVLDSPAVKTSCLLQGDQACVHVIRGAGKQDLW